MAHNSSKTTTCDIVPGNTTTITWKLKNWKEYSESLVTRASCLVELPDLSPAKLRFTLEKTADTEKAFDRDEDHEMTKTNVFYALKMQILDDFSDKPVSFKVDAMDTPNKLSTGEQFVTFNKDVKNMIIGPHFIYVQRLVVGSRGIRTEDIVKSYDNFFDKDTPELNIQISVTLLKFSQEEEGNTRSVGDVAFAAQKEQYSDDFATYLEESQFCDVKLKMSDEIFLPAHCIILSSRSSVFRAMLTSDMKESKEEIIDITDIGSEAMKIILGHIYTGEVELNLNGNKGGERVKQVVYGANKYNLQRLLQYCDKVLIKVVNFGNAWELLKLAKMHHMPKATEDLDEFVKKNCMEILQQTVGDI